MQVAEAQRYFQNYALRSSLTPGAQADVFHAEASDGTAVVIKIIYGQWAKRGEREIRALGLVDHPAVVRLVEHGTITHSGEQLPYMVTEFVEGGDLKSKLDQGSFDPASLPLLVSSVAEGLEAIWGERIVHRDIKPSNVLVRPDGRGVLLDLGVARCLSMTSLTVGWGAPGTPGYLSPEQARGERNLTVKSDVYSLGVTAYEAVVGDHPFGRDQALMVAATHAPNVPTTSPCSPNTASLITSLMHPLPAMRPLPSEIIRALATEVP